MWIIQTQAHTLFVCLVAHPSSLNIFGGPPRSARIISWPHHIPSSPPPPNRYFMTGLLLGEPPRTARNNYTQFPKFAMLHQGLEGGGGVLIPHSRSFLMRIPHPTLFSYRYPTSRVQFYRILLPGCSQIPNLAPFFSEIPYLETLLHQLKKDFPLKFCSEERFLHSLSEIDS